jgi:FHS family L-fucose permease-like MFS transporter
MRQPESSGEVKYGPALATLVTVFFFWGFIAAGNSVFIPFCKHFFALDQFQSQLIDFSFYLAYFLGALGLYLGGVLKGQDLLAQWGYRKAIVRGLLLSASGAALMIFMLLARSYAGMLAGLFVVGLGFSLQQTAAQPFAILLGEPDTGAARISLGGGINSFGTAIGPLVVSLALFGRAGGLSDEAIAGLSLSKVVVLYVGVGLLFLLAAGLFHFSRRLPDTSRTVPVNRNQAALRRLGWLAIPVVALFAGVLVTYHPFVQGRLEAYPFLLEWLRFVPLLFVVLIVFAILTRSFSRSSVGELQSVGALSHSRLRLGMLAIFVYVGVEVSIVSNLGELLRQPAYGSFPTSAIAPFVALYWGSLMMGRWTGAIAAFALRPGWRRGLTFFMPFVAFVVVLGVLRANGLDTVALISYLPFVLLASVIFYLTDHKPATTLVWLSFAGAWLILGGIFFKGVVSRWCIVATGLMCSVLWPCIFNLSLSGLGPLTSQGSAFLIMMILGGAILPPLQGKLADILNLYGLGSENAIRYSYLLDFLGFSFLAWSGVRLRQAPDLTYPEK